MALKGDLQRRDQQLPQLTKIQDNYMKSVEGLSPKKSLERMERHKPAEREEAPRETAQGRRREFAR
jgi:hypothetical protein